ncbi:hypothetical protein [Aeromonas veronii]|uniref:Uncharacterized protein n=1 Tax=Aeromonas veronii TaxID=654 RepID=A0A2T4MX60_AERVE|nr:hypothetical protein [Aeromonas veronii]PTH79046.1 hypothetical protein DAA48_21655 [Aeromonas veronii]
MYKFLQSLTQEERDVLAASVTDFLVEYTSPVLKCVASRVMDVEVGETTLQMLNSDKDIQRYEYDSLVKHYGSKVLPERAISSLLTFAKRADVAAIEAYLESEREMSPDSQAVMRVKHPHGRFDLFDTPVSADTCMEISLSSARLYRSRSSEDNISVQDGSGKMEFQLSAEQYVRFMRSDSMSVPCTINSLNCENYDAPLPDYHVNHAIRKNLKAGLQKEIEPLAVLEKEIIEMVEGKSFTSKKAINELAQKFEAFVQKFDEMEEPLKEHKFAAAHQIVDQFRSELEDQAQAELARLPEPVRHKLFIPMLGMKK